MRPADAVVLAELLELIAADDAIRSRALHVLSGGGIAQAGAGNPPVNDSYPDPVAGQKLPGTSVMP